MKNELLDITSETDSNNQSKAAEAIRAKYTSYFVGDAAISWWEADTMNLTFVNSVHFYMQKILYKRLYILNMENVYLPNSNDSLSSWNL